MHHTAPQPQQRAHSKAALARQPWQYPQSRSESSSDSECLSPRRSPADLARQPAWGPAALSGCRPNRARLPQMAATAARAHRPPAAGSADDVVARVKQQFAGARDLQIDLLAAELLQSGGLGTGSLVYGPPATGKTAVVRWAATAVPAPAALLRLPSTSQLTLVCLLAPSHIPARALLQALGVRHAYVDCVEGTRPRALLPLVLQQLKSGKRMRDSGYDCGVKCDSMADFRQQLPGEPVLA